MAFLAAPAAPALIMMIWGAVSVGGPTLWSRVSNVMAWSAAIYILAAAFALAALLPTAFAFIALSRRPVPPLIFVPVCAIACALAGALLRFIVPLDAYGVNIAEVLEIAVHGLGAGALMGATLWSLLWLIRDPLVRRQQTE